MDSDRETVSVVIPVLNAAGYLHPLLDAISGQEGVEIAEIILVDSGSTDATAEIAGQYDKARWLPIENFSHGRARNIGVAAATGEVVLFLSQDALPADERWAVALVNALRMAPDVAAGYSRQLPRADANPMEQYFLETHFPDGEIRAVRKRPGQTPAFQKDIFFSNVSSAIRRSVSLEVPFDEDLIMSEDQQFARDVLEKGYAVVYQPRSKVWHSHRYSLASVFKRYFDSVYAIRCLFKDHRVHSSVAIGIEYLAKEFLFILRHRPLWLPYYLVYNASKASATLLAHVAESLPRALVKRMSLHRYYWENE